MPDDMDEMEARLAAFIDGTLPAGQRAEIEAYLKANPSHAKLIAELQSIKSAVSSLPREKAPPEVLDTLQSHLERHSLLSEEVEEESVAVRINNWWPQVGAVAALLMLAAGLGLLIYQVLPSGQPSARQMALLQSSASRPGDDADGVPLSDLARADDKNREEKAAGDTVAGLTAARGRSAPANVSPYANNAAGDVQQSQIGMAQQSQNQIAITQQSPAAEGLAFTPAITAFGNTAERTGGALGDAANNRATLGSPGTTRPASVRVLIVSTDDPALTANLVAGGLAAQGVRFERLNVPAETLTAEPTTVSLALANLPAATPPAAVPAYPLAEITLGLQATGDLPGDRSPAELFVAARPVLVPGASAATRATVRAMLDNQRPGRQSSKLTMWPVDAAVEIASRPVAIRSATAPATMPVSKVAEQATTQEISDALKVVLSRQPTVEPFVMPTSRANDQVDVTETTDDLLVLILPQPVVMATQPATTQSSAAPTTMPLLDEVP